MGQSQLLIGIGIIRQIAEQSEKLIEANEVINSISTQTELSAAQSKVIATDIKSIKNLITNATIASDMTDNMFKVIMERIAALGALENRIKSAMTEQASGSRQILEATTLINTITVKVRDGAGEMLNGSQAIMTESQPS